MCSDIADSKGPCLPWTVCAMCADFDNRMGPCLVSVLVRFMPTEPEVCIFVSWCLGISVLGLKLVRDCQVS
jgi:hypothetical protein